MTENNTEINESIRKMAILKQLYHDLAKEMPVNDKNVKLLHEDIFAMLYTPNYEYTEDGTYIPLLQTLEGDNEFTSLKRTTEYNDIYSFVGAAKMAEYIISKIPPSSGPSPNPDGPPTPINSNPAPTPSSGDGDGGENNQTPQEQLTKNLIDAAIKESKKKIDEAESIIRGYGIEKGSLKDLNIEDKVEIISTMMQKESNELKEILLLSNKLIALAKNAMAEDPEYLPTKISKITYSEDPSHLAEPSVLLDDDLFYASMAEGKLTVYDIKERWEKERGPIILLIDTSASMSGDRNVYSKAIAVVLRKIALEQKRRMRSIIFSSPGEYYVIDFDKNKYDHKNVISMVKKFFGGGTSYAEPFSQAIDAIERNPDFHDASIIMITDGECDDILDSQKEWLTDFIKRGNKNTIFLIGDRNSYYYNKIQKDVPNTGILAINFKNEKDDQKKIIDVLKGEMYVKRSLFKSRKNI